MNINISTPDLTDEFHKEVSVVQPILKHYGGLKNGYGKIITISCFEDNSLVAQQVNLPGNDSILVIDGKGSLQCSLFGDQLALAAISNGWAGIIINGCLRDVEIIASLPLMVMALESIPRKTIKLGKGKLNLIVNFAGVYFSPDDYLYADETGIIISKKNLI